MWFDNGPDHPCAGDALSSQEGSGCPWSLLEMSLLSAEHPCSGQYGAALVLCRREGQWDASTGVKRSVILGCAAVSQLT